MNEHEKALPAGGPAKLTQNAVKIYVISSRERLLLPLAFCFCLLLVNTLLWSGPTAGLTASVCVWYGLLGLYLGRTLLNTWESRVLLAVNLALAATLALGSNWYFRAWNLLALLALLPVHAIGLSGGQFLPWWRPSMLWERLCLLLWGLFGHLGAALATAWPQKKDGAARRVIADAGYGPYFGHSFGHSVGVEIHENPNATPSNSKPLPAGVVISAEPGIYLPGKLGVRIEDVIVITEQGCQNITLASKELLIL